MSSERCLLCGPVLALVLLLSACGTTPENRYFLLSAAGDGPGAEESLSLGVGPVSIPAYLDREQLLRVAGNGEVEIRKFERWAEPLESGISRVLALNLAALRDTRLVIQYPWRHADRPDYSVSVSVLRLDARPGAVLMEADWRVRDLREDKLIVQRRSSMEVPLDNDGTATIIAAHDALLLQLCEAIAAVLPRS